MPTPRVQCPSFSKRKSLSFFSSGRSASIFDTLRPRKPDFWLGLRFNAAIKTRHPNLKTVAILLQQKQHGGCSSSPSFTSLHPLFACKFISLAVTLLFSTLQKLLTTFLNVVDENRACLQHYLLPIVPMKLHDNTCHR